MVSLWVQCAKRSLTFTQLDVADFVVGEDGGAGRVAETLFWLHDLVAICVQMAHGAVADKGLGGGAVAVVTEVVEDQGALERVSGEQRRWRDDIRGGLGGCRPRAALRTSSRTACGDASDRGNPHLERSSSTTSSSSMRYTY